jgi:polar amino acid transport system substrate-binding protein
MELFNTHMMSEGIKYEFNPVMNENETILVVDDNKEIRRFLHETLNIFGYSVISAEDAKEGLKRFIENRNKIQLLLLDVVMPEKDGIELYREIKELEPRSKVIFMSGYNEVFSNHKDILEEGIKCISKPFAIKALLREIREALDKKE